MPPNRPPQRSSLQTRRDEEPHPSWGQGNPYSQDLRLLVSSIKQLGPLPPQVQHIINELRLNNVYPSQSTERRWENQRTAEGHIVPYRRTGNSFATRLRGQDLIYLAMYRIAFPHAQHAEINAFLYYQNFGNIDFRFYSHSQLSLAESRIGLSRKKMSTTAYRAFLVENLLKRWIYWTQAYPMGIAGIPCANVIDIDECGIFLKTADRGHGKSYVGLRVNSMGHYSRNETKWTMMMGICGEDGNQGNPSRRWVETWNDGGTTIVRVYDFVQDILNDIGMATPNNFYVFTMDNLNSHRNVAVITLIHTYGHGVVFRAPYWAVDGSIEFVFNTIQTLLRSKLSEINNDNDLLQAIHQTIQGKVDFGPYFRKVGFN
jgi:hypothetical protein